nr:gamma aminobutyrate transaminase 1, mitochondrial [Ipomoea batatas]
MKHSFQSWYEGGSGFGRLWNVCLGAQNIISSPDARHPGKRASLLQVLSPHGFTYSGPLYHVAVALESCQIYKNSADGKVSRRYCFSLPNLGYVLVHNFGHSQCQKNGMLVRVAGDTISDVSSINESLPQKLTRLIKEVYWYQQIGCLCVKSKTSWKADLLLHQSIVLSDEG